MDKNVENNIKMFAKEIKSGIMDDMSPEQSAQFIIEGLKMCVTSKNEE